MIDAQTAEVAVTTRTVLATRLPEDVSKRQIEEYFSECGPIKKCFMVRDDAKGGAFKGLAYITFASSEDATKAVKKLDNSNFDNKTIQVKYSKQRNKIDADGEQKGDDKDAQDEVKVLDNRFKHENKGRYIKKEDKKGIKDAANKRKGRIIIRNLSFKANETKLKNHFKSFGEITDVKVLRRPDNKMVGCAFVQFENTTDAMKAIQSCNMKPFLGRPISVDFAIPKDQYLNENLKLKDPIKTEPDDDASSGSPKKEEVGEDGTPNQSVVQIDSPVKAEIKDEQSDDDSDGSSSDDDDDDDVKDEVKEEETDSDDDDNDDDDDGGGGEDNSENKTYVPKYTNAASKDVTEERTLFIGNIGFDVTEAELKEVLCTFGPLKYVLLCIDKLTEHPRGTAFAQFLHKEAADECLSAAIDPSQSSRFNIQGRTMRLSRAISRQDLHKKKQVKDDEGKSKDKRNLYLAREGLIRPGTIAAKEVSQHDLDLRVRREQVKRRMLQNLHIFVSPTRLCIHNLSPELTDKQLRDLFKKYGPANGKINEVRVMRDFHDLDDSGVGKSKEYGFISYTLHEHALAALRSINNNPTAFTKDRRPVVAFSLENRSALKARENRCKKSRDENPNYKQNKSDGGMDQGNASSAKSDQTSKDNFTGTTVDLKQKGKIGLPSHTGPKIRHRDQKPGKGKISRNQLRRSQHSQHGKKRKNNSGSSQQSKKPRMGKDKFKNKS